MKVTGSRVEAWLERGQGWGRRTRGVVIDRVSEAVVPGAVMRRRDLPGLRTLPEWVHPSDVLDAHDEARAALSFSRTIRLPRTRSAVDAWAALGAVGAAMRVLPDRERATVLVDVPPGLARSWFTAFGFAVEHRGDTPSGGGPLVACRVHPDGATGSTIEDVVLAGALSLAPGGILVTTVPLGSSSGLLGRAEIRGLVARAADLGLVLVGDLDNLLGSQLQRAVTEAGRDGRGTGAAAVALVRLTFIRR